MNLKYMALAAVMLPSVARAEMSQADIDNVSGKRFAGYAFYTETSDDKGGNDEWLIDGKNSYKNSTVSHMMIGEIHDLSKVTGNETASDRMLLAANCSTQQYRWEFFETYDISGNIRYTDTSPTDWRPIIKNEVMGSIADALCEASRR